MIGTPALPSRGHTLMKAIDVSPLDAGLLDTVVRLVRLLDSLIAEARFLAQLGMRELVYRLLMGEQGGRLSHIAALGGSTPTASSRPSSGSAKTSTSRFGSRTSPGSLE